jgi:nitrogen fixation protein NifB
MASTAYVGIDQVKPLGQLLDKVAEHKGCGTGGGAGKSSCGSSGGPADMDPEVWEKVKNHPCYSEEAHHHYARMHVAVAPACNIQCNYCNRKYDCANESRPGVVSEKLTPEQAAKKVLAVASAIPQMTVLGIAGPGDPLANPAKTFKTFELIAKTAPDIKLCLSTNGLALPDHVDTIASYNIDHVTITVNMVDPEVGQHIYPWIYWKNRRWTGIDAARILTEHQMRGLEMLTERKILCKINSVMIPGINDHHLVEVNRAVKSRGAFLHNIMPLISAPEHGTVFGLNGQRGPSAQELKALQDACEGDMNMMRHCRQCRADAVGLLGEDRSAEFTTERIDTMEVNYDAATRLAYQELVEEQRQAKVAAREAELETLAGTESDIRILVAVATTPRSSRSTNSPPPAPSSSDTAGSTSIARAATVTRTRCPPWSAPSTTVTPCSSPRSVAVRRTNCARPESTPWTASPTNTSSAPPSCTSRNTSRSCAPANSSTARAVTPTSVRAPIPRPRPEPKSRRPTIHTPFPGDSNGLQDRRFPVHRLFRVRARMPQCRDPREERRLPHRSQEMHRVSRPFR